MLPEGFMLPDYTRNIACLAPTISWLLGSKALEDRPVLEELDYDVDKIVLFLLDAAGELIEPLPFMRRWISLTSTFPSTTATALTTLSTGLHPGEHGCLGFSIYLKELGVIGNMIKLHPAYVGGSDGLINMGLKPESFGKTLFELMDGKSVYFADRKIQGNGLSRLTLRGCEGRSCISLTDLLISLRREAEGGDAKLIYAYWGSLDAIGHMRGPDSENFKEEFRQAAKLFQEVFIDRIRSPRKTLVLFLGDHGMCDVRNRILTNERRDILNSLRMPPTGDLRASYLYTEEVDRVKSMMNELGMYVLEREEAIKSGLFGQFNEQHEDRIGDLVAVPPDGLGMWHDFRRDEGREYPVGGHGGLHRREITIRLYYGTVDEMREGVHST